MVEPLFQIGADGVDAAKINAEIQEAVDEKLRAGCYADARVARAERLNLVNLRRDGQFLTAYLQCLRDAVEVDISDFEIRERRTGLAFFLVRLKKVIWSLLKFYTYRLWSQQNQVNALMATGLEGIDEQYTDRIAKLEARIAELEKRLGAAGAAPGAGTGGGAA